MPYTKISKKEEMMLSKSGYRERDILNRKAFATIDKQNVVTIHAKKVPGDKHHRESISFIRGTNRIVG